MILRVPENNGILPQPHLRQSLMPAGDGTAANTSPSMVEKKSVQLLITDPVNIVLAKEGR